MQAGKVAQAFQPAREEHVDPWDGRLESLPHMGHTEVSCLGFMQGAMYRQFVDKMWRGYVFFMDRDFRSG